MNLADFLLARITEDEEAARSEAARREEHRREMEAWAQRGAVASVAFIDWDLPGAPGDPARVLAECDAKRRIVEVHDSTHECPRDGDNSGWWDDEPCDVLRLLALPYADHPDYDETWRP